ncbi:hypothetical protein MRB53_032932 [Persea americana]|uniref:Uncharacterized protein n=1 Tax=Persea americana TaxID=3435 RepID=A0ACC2KT98_PERAE|nr:hypothetical protein MRB53_032932 [Persea americana]
MAYIASKIDNEDMVRRCKERRRLMKQVIFSRHHLLAAHFDYFRSLRLTGSTLSIFAAGEPLSVSDGTPTVLLHPPSSTSTTTTNTTTHAGPPPPPRPLTPSPATTSTSSFDTITGHNLRLILLSPLLPPPLPAPKSLTESSPSTTPPQKPSFPKYPKYPHLPTNSSFTPLLMPPPSGNGRNSTLPSLLAPTSMVGPTSPTTSTTIVRAIQTPIHTLFLPTSAIRSNLLKFLINLIEFL